MMSTSRMSSEAPAAGKMSYVDEGRARIRARQTQGYLRARQKYSTLSVGSTRTGASALVLYAPHVSLTLCSLSVAASSWAELQASSPRRPPTPATVRRLMEHPTPRVPKAASWVGASAKQPVQTARPLTSEAVLPFVVNTMTTRMSTTAYLYHDGIPGVRQLVSIPRPLDRSSPCFAIPLLLTQRPPDEHHLRRSP